MKLSNGALKHKEFYFPSAKSYVIFELESLEGVRHLYVIRGMGKTILKLKNGLRKGVGMMKGFLSRTKAANLMLGLGMKFEITC